MQTKAYAEINKDDCIQYWRKRVEILIHAYIYSGFLSGTMIKYYFQRKFWGRQGLFLLQLQIIEGSEGRNFWAGLFWVPHSITPEQWTYFTAIDIQQKAWTVMDTLILSYTVVVWHYSQGNKYKYLLTPDGE